MTTIRIRSLLRKELIQIRRDRRLFGILIMAPIIQLIVLGFAATTEVKNVGLAIRDNDHSFQSREYVRALESSDTFKIQSTTESERGDGDLLMSGRAGLLVLIPYGFGRELIRGRPSVVQVIVDGSDSHTAVTGLQYLQKATRQFSSGLVQAVYARQGSDLALPAVKAETRFWYNPNLVSRFHMVPAIMGVLLLVTTMLVTSMALVKEREEGTMEQLIVTPLRAGELIAGKLLPFVIVGFFEVTLALPVMRGVFGVPLRGSIALLYLFSGFFLLSTLGLGLFISTLVKTQQQAMLVSGFFVMMPFVLLSGFIFPVENMPTLIRGLAHLIPLKYYLVIVRGIFLKGVGWADLWPNALILLLWGAGILTLAILKFRKKLD